MQFQHYIRLAEMHCTASFNPLNFRGKPDVPALQAWLDGLNFKGRSAPGMKKYVERLRNIQDNLDRAKEYGWDHYDNVLAALSWWKQSDIDLINEKLSKTADQIDTLGFEIGTYHNNGLSFQSFKTKAAQIEKHLKAFTGFHKKALRGGIVIRFVTKAKIRAKATYKSELDELWIRADAATQGNTYASLLYIVTHEIGHRYERLYRVSVDFDKPEWWTTRYSQTDSMAGSESFAELFALSFDPVRYQQRSGGDFTETIDRFIAIMR